MTPADQHTLRQILQTFDETGLVALSNKGLVRRATKDLEAGGLRWEEADSVMLVYGPGWKVTMPPTGPADAQDDTPATGITRQILTATLFLRDHWSLPGKSQTVPNEVAGEFSSAPSHNIEKTIEKSVAETTSTIQTVPALEGDEHRRNDPGGVNSPATATPDVSGIVTESSNPLLQQAIQTLNQATWDDLAKWTGKSILAEASALMQTAPDVEIESRFGLTIRFTQHETEVRLVPKSWGKKLGALLDQFLVTCPRAFRPRWIVAAVFALQKQAGVNPTAPTEAATRDTSGAVLSRSQVVHSTMETLESLTTTGLAHPSERMVQRLFTLSVSATATHLPRLSRALRTIADEIELLLQRDAKGNTEKLFDQISFAHTLANAIERAGETPAIELMGRHRTEYEPVGDLDLSGVGAFPWRTGSGYEGVTVLFWETGRQRFFTWTETRPEDGPQRFELGQVYQTTAPWAGGPSASQLCRMRFILRQARANPQGRLSVSQQSSVEIRSNLEWPPQLFATREFDDWALLLQHARNCHPRGLRIVDPIHRIIVLRPTGWGERVFDETLQRLIWTVYDKSNCPLHVVVPWGETNESSIEFLESVKIERDQLSAIIGRLELLPTGLIVEPLSLLSSGTPQGDRVLNPGFDRQRLTTRQESLLERLRQKYGRNRIQSRIAMDDEMPVTENHGHLPAGVERRLSELEGRLMRLAEAGIHRLDEHQKTQFAELSQRLRRSGLTHLADSNDELVHAQNSNLLLRSRYLCRLHRESAALNQTWQVSHLPDTISDTTSGQPSTEADERLAKP